MVDELVGYLNLLGAGDVLKFILVIGSALGGSIAACSKIMRVYKKHIEERLKESDNMETITTSLKETQTELASVQADINNNIDRLEQVLHSHLDSADETHEKLEQAILEMNELLHNQREKIGSLEGCIDKMSSQIELLFSSDKEYFKAYIIEGYNQYVKHDGKIDLLPLQNLESIYNKYLEEMDGQPDEFLGKLIRELRNLPTTKEKKGME